MASDDAAAEFLSVLQGIEQHLRSLHSALQQEQTALRESDMDRLQQLAQDKEQSTTLINQLEAQRGRLLQSHGYEPSPQSMEHYIASLAAPSRRQARQRWEAIMPLAGECERLNKLNGIVVAHQQRRAQSLLSLLRNEAGGADCYAADGNREGRGNGKSLARA